MRVPVVKCDQLQGGFAPLTPTGGSVDIFSAGITYEQSFQEETTTTSEIN